MTKKEHARRYGAVPGLLRHVRDEAKLTQRDLAQRLRRGQPWIHKSEIGQRRVDIAEFVDWCMECRADPQKALRQLLKSWR